VLTLGVRDPHCVASDTKWTVEGIRRVVRAMDVPQKGQKSERRLEDRRLKCCWRPPRFIAAQRIVTSHPTKLQNLRGQTLLFRCLDTGFITTAPALTRYQHGRGIDPARRELVGERPANWVKEVPTSTCEHCGAVIRGNQWTLRQHQQSKRCQRVQQAV